MCILLAALLVPPLAASHAGDEPQPGIPLKPGMMMILKFPELPQSLYALQSGQDVATQACVALPENFSMDRRFPLFVFLNGGHGGPAAGPGRGQQIMENNDCIFVNMPLFKRTFDPQGPFKGLLVDTEEDGETICRAYTAILGKIYSLIPNIDTAHNTIGGMSNGGHTIVAICEKGDDRLVGLFRNLVLVEGGWHSIKTFDRYRGKAILYLYGDYAGQDDWLGRRMRKDLPKAAGKFSAAVVANKLDATGLVMQGTGHDMPARHDVDVREWVLRQLTREEPGR